ncbi:hypothetical protein GCM10027406_07410 [Leifsonia lichenia]
MRRTIALPLISAGVVASVLAIVGTTTTVSALTDRASLTIGPAGIGSAVPFGIVTVGPDGTVHHAPPGSAAALPLTGDDAFVPGRSISVDLGVANNAPGIAAQVTIAIGPSDAAGTGQVGTSPNITPFIRVTVIDAATSQLLLGGSATDPSQGVTVDQANAVVGRLGQRDAPPLADGEPWAAGAADSRRDLTVILYYIDTPETSAYNGGATALEVVFDGSSSS